MNWLADLIWDLGRKAEKHRRKRMPGDEDHFFPRFPDLYDDLAPHQCFFCHEILPERPRRGCRGKP
jgi:hypothetical protein